MTMPATGPAVTWRVSGQTEETVVQPGGVPVRGVRVFYVTGNGATGSVFIPQDRYTVDHVRSEVEAAAVRSAAVGALTGEAAGS